MRLMADLHMHGKYSRATSINLDIPNIEKYAKLKGVNLIGTGDFTHPKWIEHLKEELTEDDSGFLKTKQGSNFVLQTEISLIYSQDGKGRRIHNVVLAPSFEVVDQITEFLKTKGRVDYDGRPIFGISCVEFTENLKQINKNIEIIPAHIWTPWFSLFGSKSGFDSIKDCFKDQTKHIHALETGLSSDPEMNWRLSQLDNYTLVSFSDSHSFWPWRMGRENTIFDIKPEYKELINAIRENNIVETIEVDPSYGKYHLDGHRNCKVVMTPSESKKNKNLCPACKKPLTIGVLHRIEELADRPEGFKPKTANSFRRVMPLSEIIGALLGRGVATKSVWTEYYKLVKGDRSEYDVLLNLSFEELKNLVSEELSKAIMLNRKGKINVKPGYDGEYGVPVIKIDKSQKGLGNFR